MTEKPLHLPLRQWIIQKMVVGMAIPQSTVEAIISHQFQAVVKAFKQHRTVEVSGFGKFTYIDKKALFYQRKYQTLDEKYTREMLSEGVSPTRKHNMEVRLIGVKENLRLINEKLECTVVGQNLRGLEKPPVSPAQDQTAD